MQARETLAVIMADTEDAREVLAGGPLDLYPEAVALLEAALQLEREASATVQPPFRDALLRDAVALQEEARALLME